MRRLILLFIYLSSFCTFHSALAQQYKVSSFCWERVEVTSELDAKPSAEAAAVVAPYKASVDSIMVPPLGLSRVAMSAGRPESLLGNWAADVMVEGGTAIASLGYEGADDVPVIIDQAEKMVLRISNRKGSKDFAEISEVLSDTINHIQAVLESRQSITGVATGFVDLDKLTAGLHPSDFIILAARPSMGKTALALNIAQNVAIRGAREGQPKKRVAFFSLEMSREQLVQRMLCSEADVDAQRLRAGGDNKDNDNADLWNKLWVAAITIMEMRSKARRLQAEGGLDLVVIDYLQLMQGTSGRNNSDNRQQEVSEISRGLKALARELNVPVLALSQLSRSVEARQVKKPMLSDLRESGSLEQDADIVMFLYRDDYYKGAEEAPTHITELIVAKHRNGPVGRVNLFFKNECTKFISLARRPEDGGRR